ncbi:MAG: mercuric reductase [Gemmatimonadota bacterium]|nr:MAG: mercuric reductase [Gemmatimonadota bacterium]
MDVYNEELVSNVFPADWVNPEPAHMYNLVVIGAGSAGLTAASGAAGLGAKVALVERHLFGGDCLNYGCVPSKCVIRSSRAWADVRGSGAFGIRVPDGVEVDFSAVMERMRRLRAKISHHDAVDHFKDSGIDVFLGDAVFASTDTIDVDGKILKFKKAVLATGARAVHPQVDGLKEAGYFTNETIFNLTERPSRLAVIGGGPLGCELAQAFQRFGSQVTIMDRNPHLLPREDSDAADILQNAFIREGIRLVLNVKLKRVEEKDGEKVITFDCKGKEETIPVDEILIGAGRAPNVEGMDLEKAGVKFDAKKGIEVNDHLQTTNHRIYAAGDCCMKYKFTHTADAAARLVIANAMFPGHRKLSALTMPWCTYTDPEIAHVGMYERDAHQKGVEIETFQKTFSDLDRAITDGEEEGFVKVHVKKGTDKILGATIVARHAGEMIGEISVAIVGDVGLKTIANIIHPYPTQAEAIKQVGDEYNRTRLTPFVKSLFSRWFDLTRK